MEINLKYGCNPYQDAASVSWDAPASILQLLNGTPSYINVLDGLRGWQLVRELSLAISLPAAASFKHVNPAGAAIAGPLDDAFRQAQFLSDRELSPLATAYAKARSGDRVASFGDFISLSDRVDESCALLVKGVVSDGIIAPSYDQSALDILKEKRGGKYIILQIDASYRPPPIEDRVEFGLRLTQERNDARIDSSLIDKVVTQNSIVSREAEQALLLATIVVKYVQSNSICVVHDGQAVGIGAGQQSRIACTRIACEKADQWFLQEHPKALSLEFNRKLSRTERIQRVDQYLRFDELAASEKQMVMSELKRPIDPITPAERTEWLAQKKTVALSSDGYIPFRDNIDRASQSGITHVIQPGGSERDDEVTAAANDYGMVMIHSGLRLFVH